MSTRFSFNKAHLIIALGKLTPEATPEKSTGPFVGGKGDVSQPTSTPATPDQNNFAGKFPYYVASDLGVLCLPMLW